MLISRTPLRISFTGWGSDLPSFYQKFWWAVISTTIDKYVYITVHNPFEDIIRLKYSKTEEVNNVKDIEHNYFREILKFYNVDSKIEITSISDIPSSGSGLWSSSSFCVWTLHALSVYKWKYISPEELAQQDCIIEMEKCWQPIWKQDQYAAAYWWLNFIKFNADDTVSVEPIICLPETKKRLSSNLIMLYTWITRSASNILANQNKNIVSDSKKQDIMKEMVKLTYELKKELENNNLNNFWKLLHKNWLLKKEMSGWISNPQIDEWYNKAMSAWAEWWKILWAWWWGFLLFYVPKDRQEDVYFALKDLRKVKFDFDNTGSKIIFIN
jgi:D-glycero-alpha-D-manno-heptose-7-phosphate kinase